MALGGSGAFGLTCEGSEGLEAPKRGRVVLERSGVVRRREACAACGVLQGMRVDDV